ncbi:MAG TPA: helix-turn-helix domain-containing protein, partial [Thermomicrobiales bacterium]|nr:helix-turn-helix domain-containing protein [Thermomicrobiales bacterium]
VLDAVVRHYKAPLRDLLGRSRTKDIVLPRQVAMYLLREETGASLIEIGHELGGRDHTTVLHGIRQIERALSTDNALRSDILSIREAIFSAAVT